MKKLLSLVLTLAMLSSLAACAQPQVNEPEVPAETEAPVQATEEVPALDTQLPIRAMVLNGTTGFGMANLMHAAQNGEAKLNYSFTVETDASNITAALINGSVDIAALPTNAAASLYNKTQGGVQIIALNTRGVLYVITNGDLGIATLADLEGKTVYVPGQGTNPEFVLRALLKYAGLTDKVWQFFTVVPDFTSTGVKDGKRLDYWPVIIRAVNTVDAMVCTVPEIDWAVLKKITDRILSEVDGVCRVCFDMSPKPIATIEWE